MATFYVTPAGAGAKNGAAWASAFGEAEFEADLEGADGDDIYYVQAGTYTLDSSYDATTRDGGAGAPISIIGVKEATSAEPPAFSDWGSAADRPTFACGANTFKVGAYYKVFNCIFTGTGGSIPDAETYSVLYNCKSTVTSDSNQTSHTLGPNAKLINCEITGAGAGAHTGVSSSAVLALFNYIHDMGTGGTGSTATESRYIGNVFDTLATGVSMGTPGDAIVLNNTFYECDTAVAGSSSFGSVYINNIIEGSNTDGFKQTTQRDGNFYAYNHGNDTRNTDMWDTVATTLPHGELGGGSASSSSAFSNGDPAFTNAASGDFSFANTAECVDNGMALALGTATAGKMNQGAYSMTQVQAGGGVNMPRTRIGH